MTLDTEKYESFDAQMQIIEGGANIVSRICWQHGSWRWNLAHEQADNV